MNRLAPAFVAIALLSANSAISPNARADEGDRSGVPVTPEDAGIPINNLVWAVARKIGRKFIIDSRVHGRVQLIGEEADNVTYSELLTILQLQGFTAVDGGGFLRVIPDAIVRQSALPLVIGTATYPDAQYVAAVIPVRKVPAVTLIPILRPLLPQQAHLAAAVCSNSILMVDTFANIRRIESLIAQLDVGDSYKVERCENVAARP
jgi:general secretion pathway protein D